MKIKFLFLVLLLPSIIFSQSAEDILGSMQEKFKTMNNFKADFTQTIKQDAGAKPFKNDGVFYYKLVNKIRIELDAMTIVTDNSSLWNYDKRQNRVLINIVEDNPSAFSIEKYILEYPDKCKISVAKDGNNNNNVGVELVPLDPDLEFNSVKLWSDNKNIVNKIELLDLNDMIITIELKNIRVNQNIPDTKFIFNPPEGSQIIDLR